MEIDLSNFDLSTFYNEELREIPNQVVEFDKAIEFLLENIKLCKDQITKAKLYSIIGYCYKITENYVLSIGYLNLAVSIFSLSQNYREFIVANLRLIQSYQYNLEFILAHKTIDQVENTIEIDSSLQDYNHYLFQHKAKVYFDQKNYFMAKNYFEKALKLRLLIGNEELIKSTQFCLSIVYPKLLIINS